MQTKLWSAGLAIAMAAGSIACTEGTTGNVGLSMSTRSAPLGAPVASVTGAPGQSVEVIAVGDSTIVILGSDSIIIRSVELVLREIELKRLDAQACPDSAHEGDACEEFETGPELVSLPLGGATETAISIVVPPGSYDQLEFKVHKPTPSEDAAFLALHPDFDGVSIRVTGTYSAAGSRSDFVFTSDLNESQEILLSPPLDVAEGSAVNLTLRLDVSSWFVNAGGTALVDPATANKGGPSEGVVKDNIEQSIDAFHDDDHDGLDDDHEE